MKAAIVTAASSGIGEACARELRAQGFELALMARSGKVHALAEELGAAAIQGDVTKPEDLDALVELALARFGRVDAALVNTGHPPKGELLEIPDGAWHAALDLLLLPTVRLARTLAPIMAQQGGGAIVNLSTAAALEPNLAFPVSSALRAALAAFTRLFAARHGAQNLRMNCVLPGFVENWPVGEETLRNIPLGRPAKLEEVARTVAFLLSDSGAYLNGVNLRLDGGMAKGL